MSSRPGATTTRFVVVLVALAVILLACGLVMGIAMAGHMGGGMMGRAGYTKQTPISAQGDFTVDIRDFEYFPRELAVNTGATVTWTNGDSAPHTATDREQGWDTGTIEDGEEKTIRFEVAGEYEYYCTLHPSMKASLTVR